MGNPSIEAIALENGCHGLATKLVGTCLRSEPLFPRTTTSCVRVGECVEVAVSDIFRLMQISWRLRKSNSTRRMSIRDRAKKN